MLRTTGLKHMKRVKEVGHAAELDVWRFRAEMTKRRGNILQSGQKQKHKKKDSLCAVAASS